MPLGNGGGFYVNPSYVTVGTSATTYPVWTTTNVTEMRVASTEWERAAVKAEPDDEFSWLRKRVREIEDVAFA